MKKIIVFCFSIAALIGCTKDKFKTIPQVEIESMGPDQVVKGQLMNLRATVRDKEGDIDSLFLVRKRFNGANLLSVDTLRYTIEGFGIPTRDQFEVSVYISYGEQQQDVTAIHENLVTVDNRFYQVGVVVKDKQKNRSDYVESGKILLRKL